MKNDSEIQRDVMSELKWQPILNAANIGVAVKNGIVTLSGQVGSYAQKVAAENATRKVAGVRAIAEDIQIGVSPMHKRSDAEIAETVLQALRLHSAVPHEGIRVKVDDGFVTLEGTVDWDFQRSSAKTAIGNLPGVRGLINLIELTPNLKVADIKTQINDALRRTATIDAERIQVAVSGTKVELHGIVRSLAEKEDAEQAAWCAPGVTTVESHLEVQPEHELSM